ncbi:MAG: spore coat protein [Clostridia bacterium]
MPALTPSELLQVHEVAMACANQLEKSDAYLAFVENPNLEALLRHHRQKARSHYEELVEMARSATTARAEGMDGGLPYRERGRAGNPEPLRPRREAGFSDRTIATDLLIGAKSMAVNAVGAATEMSHVSLRRALSEMSRYYLDAAYEVYRFMEQEGWYTPLRTDQSADSWFRETHEPIARETLGRDRAPSVYS